jgi:antitoxin (DNA-binding transcriptional repressor) of toxin-antitoxin stability system
MMSRSDNKATQNKENPMRIYLQDVSGNCSNAVTEMKTGKHVILTEHGVPVALIQPLRPATEDEERAIHEMIDSGLLQPGRRSGAVREWKWKSKPARSSAA